MYVWYIDNSGDKVTQTTDLQQINLLALYFGQI